VLKLLHALTRAEHFVKTCKSYSARYEKFLPKLSASEVWTGSLLGTGGYFHVHEVKSFRLRESTEENDEDRNEKDVDQRTSREYLRAHVYRENTGDCRYAVKHFREHIVKDKGLFKTAAIDIALEAKILCSVFHPNIIKLRGICSGGEMGFSTGKPEGFFIILDRLYGTLDKRMEEWRQQEKLTKARSPKGPMLKSFFGSKKVKSEDIPQEKLTVIHDISSAMNYLHKRNIIYRDIKPENFGFTINNEIKLFDFGLSKELSSCKKTEDGTYKLTGGIGTQRYMAPEVLRHERYNFSADVYSFTVLLWEILTLKRPFEGFSSEQHFQLVGNGTYRPSISKKYSTPVKRLLEDGWSSNLHNRPSFEEIDKFFSGCEDSIYQTLIDQEKGDNSVPYGIAFFSCELHFTFIIFGITVTLLMLRSFYSFWTIENKSCLFGSDMICEN